MKQTNCIGISNPIILIPKPGIDLQKWAVIACDQFTSEPEYWEQVAEIVGDAPSTLNIVLPELYLNTPGEEKRILNTISTMQDYLQKNMFQQVHAPIYVQRTFDGFTRRGLIVCLDLEQYDYSKGSQTLIRATEGTIIDRLPPRIRVRKQAPLEISHIIVLFDDPQDTVFSPLDDHVKTLNPLYDFDLMLESGHLGGYELSSREIQAHINQALQALIEPDIFANKYNLPPGQYQPLLFALGDGNHSLATAKAVWEDLKPTVSPNHPARYALVEIENIHDSALTFEPIHRLLFNTSEDIVEHLQVYWGDCISIIEVLSSKEMMKIVDLQKGQGHQVGLLSSAGYRILTIHDSENNLPVGTLQDFIDNFISRGFAERVDYVHGTQVLFEKGQLQGNVGFYLPRIEKSDLFKTIILDGALPRKTFSMGKAESKRFYLECRRIKLL